MKTVCRSPAGENKGSGDEVSLDRHKRQTRNQLVCDRVRVCTGSRARGWRSEEMMSLLLASLCNPLLFASVPLFCCRCRGRRADRG